MGGIEFEVDANREISATRGPARQLLFVQVCPTWANTFGYVNASLDAACPLISPLVCRLIKTWNSARRPG